MCALAKLCLVAPNTTVKLVMSLLYVGNVLDLVFNASMPPTTRLFTIHKTCFSTPTLVFAPTSLLLSLAGYGILYVQGFH